jgi:hypothetical protein
MWFASVSGMASPRLSLAVCALLALSACVVAGCGSTSSSSGTSSTAGVGSGGSGVGGAGVSGSNFGGSAAGTGASGAGSAGAASGCHTAADCPMVNLGTVGLPQCLPPGQSLAQTQGSCGAPGWCGRCGCPALPPGTGQTCQTDVDCPAVTAGSAASHCSNGACTQCVTSADCSAGTPVCASMLSIGMPVRMCTACAADTDCPSGLPHCAVGPGGSSCAACLSTNECQVGVCSSGACAPECGPGKPCLNPLTACAPSLRCEALTCATNATCPPNSACSGGHCARRACAKDSDCDNGACVGSFCYESLGSCWAQPLFPSSAG